MGKPSAVPEGKGIGLPSGNARLWHESIPNVEGASERKRKKNAPKEETVQQLQNKAKAALEREVVLLDSDKGRKGKSSNNDAGFLRKIMASGTLSDKMVSTVPLALGDEIQLGLAWEKWGAASSEVLMVEILIRSWTIIIDLVHLCISLSSPLGAATAHRRRK